MTEVPPDHILYDEALKIATETSQSQGRETQRQGGESASGGNNENGMSHRRHPAEFYAGRTDQDGGGRGNQHTVGNGNNGNESQGGESTVEAGPPTDDDERLEQASTHTHGLLLRAADRSSN